MPKRYGYGTNDYGFSEVPMGGCQWSSGGSRSNSRHNDELSFTPSGRTSRMLRRRNPLGREYFIDQSRGKVMSATQAKKLLPKYPDSNKFSLQIKSGEDPLAIGGVLAVASLKSANSKTGDCYVTSAAQQSCPNGKNNVYRCPFIEGKGCYAEQANQGVWTNILNTTAAAAEADSLEIAKAEAAAIEKLAAYLNTYENGPSKLLRIHIVGDAVTADSARVIAEAAKPFVRRNAEIATLFSRNQEGRLIGNGGRGDSKVWAYTHGWRTVPREAWGEVSVLASCETQEDMEEAYAKGYALAAVVKKYENEHLWKSGEEQRWKAYPSGNFIILPCPNEAGSPSKLDPDTGKSVEGKKPQCFECGLCLKEKMLREKRMVIAFETHGSSTKVINEVLVQLKADI